MEAARLSKVAGKPATDELSVMASKVSMLGQRLRGALFEVSDLRGNIDHLLQDLEDAVFIFNRDRRLVFASGSVEKFLGKQRADLAGSPARRSGNQQRRTRSRPAVRRAARRDHGDRDARQRPRAWRAMQKISIRTLIL